VGSQLSGKHQEKHIVSDSEGVPWTRAVEAARGLPEDSLTPVFKIRGQGSVHESITEAAAKKAGIPFSEDLKKGVRWPDVPSESAKNETDVPNAVKEYFFGDLKKQGTILHDSHYGSKQYWHSMVPNDGKTHSNKEVRDLIVQQAVAWYEQAQKSNNIFHLGKALHMVQDSYSASHVMRDKSNGGIVTFQSYDKQDERKHGEADKPPHFWENWEDVPGAKPAVQASTRILELYKHHAPSKDIEKYLKSEVFVFANGDIHHSIPETRAGGSDARYLPDNMPRDKNPDHSVNSRSPLNARAKAYAELPEHQVLDLHPELAGFYAARNLVGKQAAMDPVVLARFDVNVIKSIAKGELLQVQQDTGLEKSLGQSQ